MSELKSELAHLNFSSRSRSISSKKAITEEMVAVTSARAVAEPAGKTQTQHPLELFLVVLFERADAATDPLDRASWEDHAYAIERLIDHDNGIPWRRL